MSVSNRLYKQSSRLPKYEPLSWKVYFLQVMGKDAVLWAALSLAVLSCIVARPSPGALAGYLDVKTLACLACLMTASGGFMISGVFDYAAARLVNACRTARSLKTAMIACVFFSSMFITNDVALIVFVPVTLLAFKRACIDPMLTVVLETVAANVGSILLPTGNPQNLFLFSRYQMGFLPFFEAVLPLSLAGLAVLAVFCLATGKAAAAHVSPGRSTVKRGDVYLYAFLFAVAVLGVFDILDYRISLAVTVGVVAARGRNLAQQIDYALLLTFVGFFVFVGNIAHLPAAAEALAAFVEPRPFWAAVLSSQVISNVPAAVMLSEFTDNHRALLAGVSAGGCGTLIASMASLISYKLYVRSCNGRRRYLLVFTLVNILFLAVMAAAHLLTSP